MNTAVYVLRALQLGLSITELEEIDQGLVMDMIIESSNDNCEYDVVATQNNFDSF